MPLSQLRNTFSQCIPRLFRNTTRLMPNSKLVWPDAGPTSPESLRWAPASHPLSTSTPIHCLARSQQHSVVSHATPSYTIRHTFSSLSSLQLRSPRCFSTCFPSARPSIEPSLGHRHEHECRPTIQRGLTIQGTRPRASYKHRCLLLVFVRHGCGFFTWVSSVFHEFDKNDLHMMTIRRINHNNRQLEIECEQMPLPSTLECYCH